MKPKVDKSPLPKPTQEGLDFVDKFLGAPAAGQGQRRTTAALSVKERELVKVMAGGAGLTEAAKATGIAKTNAQKMLSRDSVQGEFRRLLASRGLGDEQIAETLKDCLGATNTLLTKEGDAVVVPDYRTRLATAQYVGKVAGHVVEKPAGGGTGGGGDLHVHFERLGFAPDVLDRFDAALKRLESGEYRKAPLMIDVAAEEPAEEPEPDPRSTDD